jgi:hypothetical protein
MLRGTGARDPGQSRSNVDVRDGTRAQDHLSYDLKLALEVPHGVPGVNHVTARAGGR